MPHYSILMLPINELEFSPAFKEMAVINHFKTLKEIIICPVNVLLLHNGFTYHIYKELREYMKQRNLLDQLNS